MCLEYLRQIFYRLTNGNVDDPQARLAGENLTLVLVGAAGVGKSTLVSSIMPTYEFGEGVMNEMRKTDFPISLTRGPALLTVCDSPGFTGRKAGDVKVAEDLERTKAAMDALLICFDLSASSGRYMPMLHGVMVEKVTQVFGTDTLKQKAVLVLTKGNLVSQQSKSTGVSAMELADQWRKEFYEDQEEMIDVPVVVAGRVVLSARHGAAQISEVDGKTRWFDDLWNKVADRGSPALVSLMTIILQRRKKELCA